MVELDHQGDREEREILQNKKEQCYTRGSWRGEDKVSKAVAIEVDKGVGVNERERLLRVEPCRFFAI